MIQRLLVALLILIGAQTGAQRALVAEIAAHEAQRPPTQSPAVRVAPGGDLQAALDKAPEGATVLLPAGARYVGSFTLRRSVTLRTSGELPERRVTPEDAGTFAVLHSPTNEPALRCGPGVTGVRVDGLEIAPNGHAAGTALECGSSSETDVARQPSNIALDRLLVRGHPERGQKRGLSLHGSAITVTRSHIADIKLRGQDTQAIWINNGTGPYTIADNYLEASGENIMTGGDTPRIADLVPSDILIEGNTIAKPLAWKSERWTIKNLVEFKSARRVAVRDNVLAGSWVSGQVGYGILITPKDQYGRAPWTVTEDILIEGNIIRDVAEGLRVLGDDDQHPAQRSARITIRDNLIVADHRAHGGSGRCLTLGRAPQQVEFSQNTCITNGGNPIYVYVGGAVKTIENAVFANNLWLHNSYGFGGEVTTADANATLERHYPGAVFKGNVVGGGDRRRYPEGTVILSDDAWRALFVDFDAGDYRLKPGSPHAGKGWQPSS